MITRRTALSGGVMYGLAGCMRRGEREHTWHGEALGAPGSITLYGATDVQAEASFERAQQIITRLTAIFSLFRPTSEISRLNRTGLLEKASPEMLELLFLSRQVSIQTKGVFDITVQVLWELIQQGKTSPAQWQQQQKLVGFEKIIIQDQTVRFARPGMAITLNGIAQGYISQQVAKAMEQMGAFSGLVNLGEFQAFGERPFSIGIQNPNQVLDTLAMVELQASGLATSAASGGYLGDQLSHILTPHTVLGPPIFASASVVHPSAAVADGLATAFTLMNEVDIRTSARSARVDQVLLVRPDGSVIRF